MFYILPCLLCNFCVRLFFPYYFYKGYPRLLQKILLSFNCSPFLPAHNVLVISWKLFVLIVLNCYTLVTLYKGLKLDLKLLKDPFFKLWPFN